jgi:hypothetical protein
MMISNLRRHRPSDPRAELAAYLGEVPPPFWSPVPSSRPMLAPRPVAGEVETALPYRSLPDRYLLATAVSLDELDDLMERRARREEHAGS